MSKKSISKKIRDFERRGRKGVLLRIRRGEEKKIFRRGEEIFSREGEEGEERGKRENGGVKRDKKRIDKREGYQKRSNLGDLLI